MRNLHTNGTLLVYAFHHGLRFKLVTKLQIHICHAIMTIDAVNVIVVVIVLLNPRVLFVDASIAFYRSMQVWC